MNESQESTPNPVSQPDSDAPTPPPEPAKSFREEAFDRTTVIAFGLMFVLPAIIILFTVLFFLPYVLSTVAHDPSGVTTSAPNLPPPSRN